MSEKLVMAQRAYSDTLKAGLNAGMSQDDAERVATIAFSRAAGREKGAKLLRSDVGEWEQIVMCEMLIPDVPNSYGDIYSREAVKEFAYEYARRGYFIDINHDLSDVNKTADKVTVVESFIARPGDKDFIEGAWVVGMKIHDSEIWSQILSGELNGYSYQAQCWMTPVVFQNLRNRQVVGVTEPDLVDGHTHDFLVLLNPFNKPVSGGTGVSNGHSHKIRIHTVTDPYTDILGNQHHHRYQVINIEGESNGAGE